MRSLISAVALTGVAVGTLVATPAAARAAEFGVQLHGGTLGAGADLAFGLSDHWNGRVGFNKYTASEDFTQNDIDYSADLELESGHALADWHPFGGGFRVSGGIVFNNNEVNGTATVNGGDQVGGQTVPPGGGGTIAANVSFNDTAPYLGIGYGNAIHGWGPLSFSVDLGVLAQGSPDVKLSEKDDIQGVNQDDLDREAKNVEDEFSDFDLYPVLQAGLIYRF